MAVLDDVPGGRDARDRHDEVLGRVGRVGLVGLGAVLALAAPLLGGQSFVLFLLTRVFVFALFALSLDFVFGYTGLPSFGHAAMFGTGGYVAALLLSGPTRSALVVLPAAFVAGLAVAAVIGWLSVRARGIYFAMLTLAFAQVLYIVAFNDFVAAVAGVESVTGGDNGIVGLPPLRLVGAEIGSNIRYFYLTFAVVAASVALLLRVANSPFGRVLQGIRVNEERVGALGYDVTRYKVVAFALSGGFAGLAGGLLVPLRTLAHPNLLHWSLSGELIVMVLLGGMGTLWGPMVGAALVVLLEDFLSAIAGWRLLLGGLFVVAVVFAPTGIAGVARSLRRDPRGALRNLVGALRRYVRSVRR